MITHFYRVSFALNFQFWFMLPVKRFPIINVMSLTFGVTGPNCEGYVVFPLNGFKKGNDLTGPSEIDPDSQPVRIVQN